jgi:hypothetical protein
VFLINNDKTKILEGRKNCGARTNHNSRLSSRNTSPFAPAFTLHQTAVQDCGLRAKAISDLFDELRRQRDFRD